MRSLCLIAVLRERRQQQVIFLITSLVLSAHMGGGQKLSDSSHSLSSSSLETSTQTKETYITRSRHQTVETLRSHHATPIILTSLPSTQYDLHSLFPFAISTTSTTSAISGQPTNSLPSSHEVIVPTALSTVPPVETRIKSTTPSPSASASGSQLASGIGHRSD